MIKPLGNNLFIEPKEASEMSAGGILVAKDTKEAPMRGTVTHAGPKATIQVGAEVLFKKYSPDKIDLDGKEYLVCSEDDIIALLTDEPK